MLMEMLEAGGVPVLGELPLYEQPIDSHVAREVMGGKRGIFDVDGGTAAKVLYPYLNRLDPKRAYDFIWLVRDPLQQAASQAKYAFRTAGIESDRQSLRKMAGDNMRLAIEGLRLCTEFSDGSRCYSRRFEWCLAQPWALARDLAELFPLDQVAAVTVVRKRDPECEV